MKKRIDFGTWVILIASIVLIALSSCTGQQAYTQRNSGLNGKTGSHTVHKTQSYYNHDAAMKRSKKN